MSGLVAMLPMRGGSERVPGKNVRPCAGRPLYRWVLDTLLAVDRFDTVVVDTDIEEILESVEALDSRIVALRRRDNLAVGTTPMNAVIQRVLDQVDGERFLQTHATNPLLRAGTINNAVDAWADAPEHDSLFSVTAWHTRLWNPDGTPLNHDPNVLLRTQDLPPVYEENSNIFLFSRASFGATGNRLGRTPLPFVMDRQEAWDIDDEAEFVIAEQLLNLRAARRPPAPAPASEPASP